MPLLPVLLASAFWTLGLQTTPIKLQTGNAAWPWARMETYRDADPHFVQESFPAEDLDLSPNDLAGFGGDTTPHSGDFLLHYGAHWDTATKAVPVLLVPGAVRSASVLFHDAKGDGTAGVAPYLISKGYKVFAITFGYNSGDNFQQAEQLANALRRITELTGQAKVDLIAASKGGVPVRIYLSKLAASWRTPYRGDVRRALLIGCPNLGLDAVFRHPVYGLSVGRMLPWDYQLGVFGWTGTLSNSLYNLGRYSGHAQMLHRWDGTYPVASFEPDWYSTYYGGWGLTSHSQGIDAAAAAAGNVIDKLEEAGLQSGIQLGVLAGSKPYRVGGSFGFSVEYQGPGDMAVFLKSALHTSGMTQNGASVLKKSVLYLNHGELLFHASSLQWMEAVLSM